MARVYAALKIRIIAGEFAPGERLDPMRLAPELDASRTPVRDALIRLSGERLIESWHNEGFRQPHVTEATIRDLQGWTNDILHAAVRSASRRQVPTPRDGQPAENYVDRVSACFFRIVLLSPNREHHAAIANANDRLATVRRLEPRLLDDAERDLDVIETALADANWTGINRGLDHFHRRRLRIVNEIAAALCPRPGAGVV